MKKIFAMVITTKKNADLHYWTGMAATIWHDAVDPWIQEKGGAAWVFDPGPDMLRAAYNAGKSAQEIAYGLIGDWFKWQREEGWWETE